MTVNPTAPLREGPIKAFAEYITSLEPGYTPRVAQFDLMTVYWLAPFIVVLDVLADERRLRCRFVGTQVVAMHGADSTGKDVEDLFTDVDGGEQLVESYWRVADTGRPFFTTSRVMRPESTPSAYAYARLCVPLLDDAGKVARLAALVARCDVEAVPETFNIVQLG